MQELKDQLLAMSKGKAGDKTGLVAEMLKSAGDGLLRCIIFLFNDVLAGGTAPGDWKTASISVMFKSGDCQLPENYRPITLLPILYKLFTKLLFSRVRKVSFTVFLRRSLDSHCSNRRGHE